MKVLILGAAGGMSMTTIKDLLQNSEVSKIFISDYREDKVRERAKFIGDPRLIPLKLDLHNVEEVAKVMAGVDVAINEAFYELNIDAMLAAMKARVPLLDLGGLYTMTKKQLDLDMEVKKAGILVIPGMGSDPGTSNILCRYGANKLDQVEEIHIRYGSAVAGVTFSFAVGTILDEAIENAVVYENGLIIEIPALSRAEDTLFRDPVGLMKTYSILHSELASIPRFIEGVRTVTYQDSWDPQVIEKMNALRSLGLLSKRRFKLGDSEYTNRTMMSTMLFDTTAYEQASDGWDELKVSVKGKEGGKETTYVLEVLSRGDRRNGLTPTSYLTGTPPSIVAQMIARGKVKGTGVLPPEACVDPQEYLTELTKRDIEFFETKIQTVRMSKEEGA
jgi:lysine 6-dehydrogenase